MLQLEIGNKVYTQSELSVKDNCNYLWYLRYYQQLDLVGDFSWPLILGTWWHSAMELLYKTKGKEQYREKLTLLFPDEVVFTSELELETEKWQEILEASCEAYAEFYYDDFKIFRIIDHEKTLEVELEIDGVRIKVAGKRDQKGYYGNKKIGLRDFKTAGQLSPSMTDGWGYKFQFMLYIWLDWKCSTPKERAEQFFVDVMKKCLLRKSKDEHIATFAARVKMDILRRPEEYFFRQQLDLTAKGVMNFEEEIFMPKLRQLAILQNQPLIADALVLNRNTDHCNSYGKQCSYFAKCYHGEDAQYKRRENKHTELVKE